VSSQGVGPFSGKYSASVVTIEGTDFRVDTQPGMHVMAKYGLLVSVVAAEFIQRPSSTSAAHR
jgi:hypothetical protein